MAFLAIGKFTQKTLQELQSNCIPNLCVIGSNFPLEEFDSVNTDFFIKQTEIALTHLFGIGPRKKLPLLVPKKAKTCMVSVAIKTPTTNAYLDIMQHYHLFNEDYFYLKKKMACWMSKRGNN